MHDATCLPFTVRDALALVSLSTATSFSAEHTYVALSEGRTLSNVRLLIILLSPSSTCDTVILGSVTFTVLSSPLLSALYQVTVGRGLPVASQMNNTDSCSVTSEFNGGVVITGATRSKRT